MSTRPFRSRKKVLLASANAVLRRRVHAAITKAGFSCRTLRDVAALEDAIERTRYDLLIVDLDLRSLDLAALAKAASAASILALVRSEEVAKALRAGAADCVTRPVHLGLLVHRASQLLRQRETRVALSRSRERNTALSRELSTQRCRDERIKKIADQDGLTGLPNRGGFLERLGATLAAAQPTRDPMTLIAVDLDFERAFRLAPGPETREHALLAICQRMRESVRDRDTVAHLGARTREICLARVGGEGFALLMPGLARAQDAYRIAQRIQESLARPIEIDGHSHSISSRWGIAVWPADGATSQELLDAAEEACRCARRDSVESIRFFAAEMNAPTVERRHLEAALRLALERDEISVHYQPRVEIATGRIVGFEALARWFHPETGAIPPGRFIPIAEETGLILPIGEHVLAVACAQNRAWQDQGLPTTRVSVNLSSVQFRDPDLPGRVAEVLRTVGLAPEWLELELTESVLMHQADSTVARLNQLEKMGVHLSIDDFGTGYSSLSYLKKFPIDALKIDQSFIRELTTRSDDAAITTSIVLMGKSLDLTVVAEGVETRSQLSLLRVIGCDEAQGYLFSRPVPAADAGALLRAGLPADLAA